MFDACSDGEEHRLCKACLMVRIVERTIGRRLGKTEVNNFGGLMVRYGFLTIPDDWCAGIFPDDGVDGLNAVPKCSR